MTDFRTMFDRTYLGSWDLGEKDVIVQIERVEAAKVKGATGEEKRAPIVYFRGKKKGLVLNVTNAKTVAKLYGKHVEKWAGKAIALYATRTLAFGEEVDCIRIRPEAPAAVPFTEAPAEAKETA